MRLLLFCVDLKALFVVSLHICSQLYTAVGLLLWWCCSCTQQWVYLGGGVAVVHSSGFTFVVVLQLYTTVGLPLWWCCSCTQQWVYLCGGVAVVHNNGVTLVMVLQLYTTVVLYHWRELPQVSFLSGQKFCCNTTHLLSWQKYACRDKIMFVTTKYFCCDKNYTCAISCQW